MATNGNIISHWTSADIATTAEVFRNTPQVLPGLRKSFGQGILTFDMVSSYKGSEQFIAAPTFTANEELPPFRTMTIGTTISGGASTAAAISFDLDVTSDVSATPNFWYYPRKGQSFWVGASAQLVEMVIHSVTALGNVNGATIVAYVKDSTAVSAATTPAGTWHPDEYIRAGLTFALSPATSHGQGTAQTTPTTQMYQAFTYYMQVLKDAKGYENAEFARAKYDEYEGIGLYNHDIAAMDTNLDASMELAMLFGNKTTNAALVDVSLATGLGVTVPGTQGMWDWIGERGYDLTFTDATDLTIDHFYLISEFAESVGLGAADWILDAGGTLLRRVEKSAISYITNATGSLSQMFTPDAGGGLKDLQVGFRSISINAGGTKIFLKPNWLMNNPLLAPPNMKDAAFLYPMADTRDGKSGERVPNMELVYRGLGEFKDRKRMIAPFIGMGGPKGMIGGPVVLEGDVTKLNALVDFGFVFRDAWKSARLFNTTYTGLA